MNQGNEKTTPNYPARKRNPALIALALAVVVALSFFLWRQLSVFIVPDVPGVVLMDMHSIEDLRMRFNQDQGAPRLILLLSPT